MIYPKFDISDFDKAEIVNQEKGLVCVMFLRGESYITAWTKTEEVELPFSDNFHDYELEIPQINDNTVWELTNDTSLDIEQVEGMKFIFNDHISHLNDVLYDEVVV